MHEKFTTHTGRGMPGISTWCSRLVVMMCVLAVMSASAQETQHLERITITAQAATCPVPDDATAHDLWRAMAHRYAPLQPLVSPTAQFARNGAYSEGSVQKEDLGSFAAAEGSAQAYGIRNTFHGIMLSSPSAFAARDRMRRSEYASRIPDDEPRLLYQPVYLNWYYARLDELFIDHFIDTSFETRHDLSSVTVSGGSVLTFCGRDHSKPWIEGKMEITKDSLLSHVAFRYFTPKPREDAAAEVWLDLDAAVDSTGRHLWPERSIFYRASSQPNVWFQSAWINVITCIWNDPERARAGMEPDLASRRTGCTKTKPR